MLTGEYELLELDGLSDLEDWESGDMEGDLLFGSLRNNKIFKSVARKAARAAGKAIAGRRGADIASMIANRAIREAELEDEYESEAEFEAEFEAWGGDMEILAEMEYLAEMAAETESEAEADEFLGAIASLAGPLISSLLGESDYEGDYEDEYEYEGDPFLGSVFKVARSVIPKVLPFVRRGISTVGRFLRRPSTRRAIRSIPKMIARTGTDLARQARAGRPMTPTVVAGAFGRNVARTLASRRQMSRIMRRRRFRGRRRSPRMYRRPRRITRRRRTIRPRYCVL